MKKIIIMALILIGIINIISCGSGKSEKTNNSEVNNNEVNNSEEIYKGYASNDMWSIYLNNYILSIFKQMKVLC